MTEPENKPPAAKPDYQVYLLRLRRKTGTGRWVISLQPAQEKRPRVFADLNGLMLYLAAQMSGEDGR